MAVRVDFVRDVNNRITGARVFCADCGARMVRVRAKGSTVIAYACPSCEDID